MAEVRRSHTVTLTYYGPLTVKDLRELVEEAKDAPDTARVSIDVYKGDQREGTSTTVTVHLT
jgi:hypothetical protein